MPRRSLAALCIALLTVIAGCGGVLGGDGTIDREPYDVAPTTTETSPATPTPAATQRSQSTPTETPVSTPTATPDSLPTLASTGFQNAVANHSRRLRRFGNFTIRRTEAYRRVSDGVDPPPAISVAKVDLAADRYAFGEPPAAHRGISLTAYQTGDRWFGVDGETLRNRTGSGGPDVLTPRRRAIQWLRALPNRSAVFPLERNGTATFDGERMRRFTAADPGQFRGTYDGFRTVTRFRAVVLVDDRGIVRRFAYTMRGRSATNATFVERQVWTVTDLGNTTVRSLETALYGDDPDDSSG